METRASEIYSYSYDDNADIQRVNLVCKYTK